MRMFEDIYQRWKQRARRSTTPLIILSPYVTKKIALSLVKDNVGARIYTLFETQVFATGGSDLDDIVELMKDHEVYRLDGLHAKMVSDNSTFVTLGSQNLTEGGRHNLELSVHLDSECAREQAMDIVEPWLENAVRITPQMVVDMRVGIVQLREAYQLFLNKCEKHQTEVDAKAKRRARRERQQAHDKSRAIIGAKLKKALGASIEKTAQVKRKDPYSTPFLKTDNKASLLKWKRPDKKPDVELDKGDRYLCFLESNDFGWARVADQQISRIGRGIIHAPGTLRAFPTLSLEISSAPKHLIGHPNGTNLVVKLWQGKNHVCTVPASFLLDELTTFDARRPKPASVRAKGRPEPVQPAPAELTKRVMAWIAQNTQAFERLVRKHVIESFNYRDGNKLAGVNAEVFFGKTGSRVNVQLAMMRSNPILHVSPLHE